MLAHGTAATPGDVWAWDVDTGATIALVAVVLVAVGAAARRSGSGDTAAWRRRWLAVAGGLAALAVALGSPLHRLSEALFAAHMVQHLALVGVAAPLLVWGAPALTGRAHPTDRLPPWSVPAATLAVVATFTAWHVPALYAAAAAHPVVHAVEHATMLATGLWSWAALAATVARGQHLVAVAALAVHGLSGVALGALLALSPVPWYLAHAGTTDSWGIDALEDQQLGGLIMWVPGGAAELAIVVALVITSLQGDDDEGAAPPRPASATAAGGTGAT